MCVSCERTMTDRGTKAASRPRGVGRVAAVTWNDNDDPNAQWRRPDDSAPPAAPPPPSGGAPAPPPPPPSSGSVPPPPPASPFGAAPSYGGSGYAVPAAPYGAVPFVPGKPPRPAIPVAGWLMVVGAVLIIVGTIIPWKTFGSQSINGFDRYVSWTDDGYLEQTPGAIFVFGAVVLLAFGITSLLAKRVLPVVIIAIVTAAGIALFSAGELAIYSDDQGPFGQSVELGDISAGIPLMLIGALIALAGAITGCAKRRR